VPEALKETNIDNIVITALGTGLLRGDTLKPSHTEEFLGG
jgi:hypothetical protein